MRTDVRLKRLEIPNPDFAIAISDDELIVQRRGQKANRERVGAVGIECGQAALRIRRQLAGMVGHYRDIPQLHGPIARARCHEFARVVKRDLADELRMSVKTGW